MKVDVRSVMEELFQRPAYGRLAASHIGQYLLARGLRWQTALQVDRVDTLILQVALSAGLSHLSLCAAGLDAPDGDRRPVSAHAISLSMGLAYETTRRRLGLLTERGLTQRHGTGYVVGASPVICGADRSLAMRDTAALYSLFGTMRSQGFNELPMLPPPERTHNGRVGRAIVDFWARSMEGFAEQHGSVTTGSIWAAIIALNVGYLLHSTTLPSGYAEDREPLPDHLRRPATLREIAEEVDLPLPTVRRHVVTMARRGTVLIGQHGIIVPAAALKVPEQLDRSRINIGHLRRLFNDVIRLSEC